MSRWLRWFGRRWLENFTWLCERTPIVAPHYQLWRQTQEYKRDAVEGRL